MTTRSSFDYPEVGQLLAKVHSMSGRDRSYNVTLETGEDDVPWPVQTELHTESSSIQEALGTTQAPQLSKVEEEATEMEDWPQEAPEGEHPSSWIIQHGGRIGEPLGSVRLPYQGPPEHQERRRMREDEECEQSPSSSVTPTTSPSPSGDVCGSWEDVNLGSKDINSFGDVDEAARDNPAN